MKLGISHRLFVLLTGLLLLLSAPHSATAYNVTRITNSDGLSNSAILSLAYDSDGFLWLGTCDGVNIYDGCVVRTLHEMYPGLQLEGNIIESIKSSSDRSVWVQTNKGLNRIAVDSSEFKEFPRFRGQEKVATSDNGTVFISEEDGTLSYYLHGTMEDFTPLAKSKIPLESVRYLMVRGNALWLVDDDGATAYPIKKGVNGEISLDQQKTKRILSTAVKFATSDGDDLFIVSPEGDVSIVSASGDVKTLCNIAGEMKWRGQISDILCDLNDNLFVSFAPGGAIKVSLSSEDKEVEDLGVSVGVFCLGRSPYQDVVWVGSDCQGLYSFAGDRYSLYSYSLEELSPKVSHPIRSIFVDQGNTLWIGTKGDGLLRIDNMEYYASIPVESRRTLYNTSNSLLLHNNVFALTPGKRQLLWIGTDSGINYYDYRDKTIKQLPGGNAVENIHGIIETNDTTLWVATLGTGVAKVTLGYTPNGLTVKDITYLYAGSEAFTSNYFFSLSSTPEGKLFFANRGMGAFELAEGNLRQIPIKNDFGTKTVFDVFSVVPDGDTLWLGTGHGLLKISPSGEELFFGPEAGFINSTIHDIKKDNDGKLWVSTNKGLVQFNPATNETQSYGKNTGLTVVEYSDGAAFKTPNSLLFGGINGISVVTKNPDFLNYDVYTPNLTPRLLNISGTDVPIGDFLTSKNGENKLTLSSRQNHFSVTFTAPDFMNAANYTFFYSLDGKNYINNGSSNTITFNEMDYGNYTLMVKYLNRATDTQSDPYRLSITILPPWYLSVWARIVYALLILGAIAGLLLIYVKRQKKLQQEQIEHMKQQHKENLYEEKLRFFTNITHEFCTPLTLMYGPCERIMSYPGADDYIKKYVGLVQSNTERLNNLIQELIDFRRMETGNKRLKIVTFNVSKLCSDIMHSFTDLAERNNINFVSEITPDIDWNSDFECIRKTMTNLISNAFKYTPVGGTIKVGVKVDAGELRLSVYNTGKGISDEDKKTIFNRYSVLDNVEENAVKGLSSRNGLGLAICHSMVEMLSGKIAIESKVGEYAEFIVTLPPKEAATEKPAITCTHNEYTQQSEIEASDEKPSSYTEVTGADKPDGKPHILVIDDNREILTLLYDGLSDYHVTTAASAEEGLKMLTRNVPDLIITDVMMPGTDGFELTRQIKGNKHTMHVPLVILSAKNTNEEKIEGIESGADVYVGKPFSFSYLKAVVARLLESRNRLKEYYNSSASAYNYSEGKLVSVEDKETIASINEFIDSNIEDCDMSPETIAEHFQWSLRNVYRKFKDLGLPSPNDHIKNRKINLAAKLLVTTSLTVQEIIFRSGFSNRSHFYREFDKRYGSTPKDYRNANKVKDNSLTE